MSERYVVLDLETTGLDPALEGILEIAALRYEGGVETGAFHRLTRPEAEITEASQAIHGITPEMVADAPPPSAVLDELLAFLGDLPLVAHNAPFDVSFLNRALALAGKPPLANRTYDTLEMSRELFPEQRSHKLEAVCRLLGHEATHFHRAMDDTRALAAVFPRLWAIHEQKQAWYQEQFKRIEQVGKRYDALNRLVEELQLELAEQRRVLLRYFQEQPDAKVALPGGDHLALLTREQWDYDLDALRPLLAGWGLQDRFLKLDRPRLERWLTGGRLDEAQKAAIAQTRLRMGQTTRLMRVSANQSSPAGDVVE